jgi:ATP-grasp ribosomal peptide maturase
VTVLVITEPADVTCDLVIDELNRRNVPVHRIDTADFPTALAVTASIGGHGQWSGTIGDPYRTSRIEAIRSVYCRRPAAHRFPPGMDQHEQRWAEQEARRGFGGLLQALPAARWMNDPHAMTSADRKPRQLAVAEGLGMAVPATLITNNPQAARAFVDAAPHGAIYKSMHARPYVDRDTGQVMALSTTPVTADMITDAVAGTAHLFQHWTPKSYEVRVNVVGDRLFSARIDAHSPAARIDWRTDYNSLTYEPITLSDRVTEQIVALTQRLGLVFAAIDLIVTPEHQTVFLEVNPGGQWAWIEHETRLPIASAIADYLEMP